MACNHIPWLAHTVEWRRACHAIVIFWHHTLLDDVSHGMPACPLGRKHRRTTSGVAYHHRHGQHTRSEDVACGMLSLPLDRTHGQMTSGVACNHIPWTVYRVKRRWACHAINVFGVHTWSDDVRHGMPACLLGIKKGRMPSGKTCNHHPWKTYKVRRRRTWHVIFDLGQNTRSDDI